MLIKDLTRAGAGASLLVLAALTPAAAAETMSSEQLLKMIQAQQQQLDALKAQLKQKAAAEKAEAEAVAAAKAEEEAKSSTVKNFIDSIKIGGVIEVEAASTETFAGADASDITLSTVEVFVDAQPHEYVSTHVQFLFEDGNNNITLDEAFAVLGNTEKFPLYLQAGKWVVPFGAYATDMSADPLTLSLGETDEAAVLVGATWAGFSIEGYVYNGDTNRSGNGEHINQAGASARYEGEFGDVGVALGIGYIRNIADSDVVTDTLGAATAINDYVGGGAVNGSVSFKGVTLRGEYVAALDSFAVGELAFNGAGAEPTAWHVEAAYTTSIMENVDLTLAATVQGTDEALALGLPETRYGGAITVGFWNTVGVTFEYLHDEDYEVSDGGTGNDAQTATLKLAVGF